MRGVVNAVLALARPGGGVLPLRPWPAAAACASVGGLAGAPGPATPCRSSERAVSSAPPRAPGPGLSQPRTCAVHGPLGQLVRGLHGGGPRQTALGIVDKLEADSAIQLPARTPRNFWEVGLGGVLFWRGGRELGGRAVPPPLEPAAVAAGLGPPLPPRT